MPSEMKYILLDLQAKDEGIAIIKINRPEVLNALNREAMSELSTAIDIVDADDEIKISNYNWYRRKILLCRSRHQVCSKYRSYRSRKVCNFYSWFA
jgi:1,4-dihydroxy-2-naphthoyl-CoA synthase